MSATHTPQPRHTDREKARTILTGKVESYRRAVNDPRHFATVAPDFILADAEWRLRWIDCAPEGANHQTAPLQDKTGTPCGGAFYESVGGASTKEYREAVQRRQGRSWQELKIAQHEATLARQANEDRELGIEHLPAAERASRRAAARITRRRRAAMAARKAA